DLDRAAPYVAGNPQRLQKLVAAQAILRSLPSAYVINSGGRILAKAVASMAPEIGMPSDEQFNRADQGESVLFTISDENQIRALVKLNAYQDAYLYVARIVDAKVLRHLAQSREAVSEYEDLEKRRFTFQITFALIYVAVALITLLAAIWLGLWAANRIVEPISRLVRASERVREGDLSTRVEMEGTGDEIDDLSNSFNRMTSQLENQRTELVAANHQLDQRSQFTEAVLSGVSAGVLGLDNEAHITLANRAALRFFGKTADEMIGRNIMVAVPEMYGAVSDARAWPERTAHRQVVLLQTAHQRTLNIPVTRQMTQSAHRGFVLTFDHITQLVHAHRTAPCA
ncbi:MAG: HAMP domain-containing protein, partial [Nitratireductor sp.]